MYFNEKTGNTNIDSEFKGGRGRRISFGVGKSKKFLLIGIAIAAIAILLIAILLLAGRNNYVLTLEGTKEVTIYEGGTFTEPGYSAYDKKGIDYRDKVVVTGNVDTSKIGTYTLTYKYHGLKLERIVKVVEKPAVVTIIHLNGEKNMTVGVGSEFVDPGYTAVDATDGDLTSKVKVTGSVDTSKAGTYQIIYTVVNSDGVTTTETRNVTVG